MSSVTNAVQEAETAFDKGKEEVSTSNNLLKSGVAEAEIKESRSALLMERFA